MWQKGVYSRVGELVSFSLPSLFAYLYHSFLPYFLFLRRRTIKWLRRNVYDTLDEGKMYSVIDQKMTPRSGTKKDYQSMGFYWWPCSKAKQVCAVRSGLM